MIINYLLTPFKTFREVQQLRQEVRTSSEMKFALQAYFALNGNNYIRFFRLVNRASFTNACIMHRYFTQIRNKALTLMMKGYSMGNRSAQVCMKGYSMKNISAQVIKDL